VGIARPIMDCLLKNNGYWIVPVPAVLAYGVLIPKSQVKHRRCERYRLYSIVKIDSMHAAEHTSRLFF
jgi:hypothetical protein